MTTGTDATDHPKPETRRDRVRRLLIQPLADQGMRFPRRTAEEDARRVLDRLADELAYASDRTLIGLREWAAGNGQGSEKCFWPEVVAFLSVAQAFEPRPVEELPVLASWFGSVAGPEARDAGRLVAEFVWIERHRCPPHKDRHRTMIDRWASEWGRRVELATDRIARGVDPGPGERKFLTWYGRMRDRADALIAAGEQRRGEAEGAA